MTEAIWIALIGVGGTLASGLGATLLAGRSRKTELEAVRQEHTRDAARLAIHDLILQARRWIEIIAPHGQVMLTKQTHEQRRAYLRGVRNGHEIEQARDEFIRAATNAQLLVGDELLRSEIDSLISAAGYWVTDLLLSSYTDPRAGELGREPREGEWDEFEGAFKATLEALVNSASNATAVKLRR